MASRRVAGDADVVVLMATQPGLTSSDRGVVLVIRPKRANSLTRTPMITSSPDGFRRKTIRTADGVELAVIEAGHGRPFVILPAWSNSAAEYHGQIAEFAVDHRVVAIDMRSHGASEKVEHGHRVSRYAADLNDVLQALDLHEVTVMGHSMGCSVLWSYLDLYGDGRIASLVLVDQGAAQLVRPWWSVDQRLDHGCTQTADELFAFCASLAGPGGEAFTRSMFTSIFTPAFPRSELAWIIDEILKMPRRQAAELFLDHAQHDWRDVISRIAVPTLVVGGSASVFPVQSMEWIAGSIRGSRLYVFHEQEMGSHFMCCENPVRFNRLVRTHLRDMSIGG